MPFYCTGCKSRYARLGDMVQHFRKTSSSNSLCKRAKKEFERLYRPVPGARPRRPRNFQPPPTRRPTLPSHQSDPKNTGNAAPSVFMGDFFGTDYGDADFPFPHLHHNENQDVEMNEDSGRGLDGHNMLGFLDLLGSDEPLDEESDDDGTDSEFENDDSVEDDNLEEGHAPNMGQRPRHETCSEKFYIMNFGGEAGSPIANTNQSMPNYNGHAHGLGTGSTTNPFHPFKDEKDWHIALWGKMRGPGSTALDELLAIPGFCQALGLSYKNSRELNKLIDSLPTPRPKFQHQPITVDGEVFDVYFRNILECVRALYGNPRHSEILCFVPERHYADEDKTKRVYHEMNTGKWWWETQKVLEKEKPGATIVPLIISSDKTQVTLFRNKSAYPVYLTIGNLPKAIRRKPSQQGQILLAYLPTTKLEHVTNKESRRRMLANLFHACMHEILKPIKTPGIDGVEMAGGDGIVRRCHPIYATFVGDYPEQCLATGTYFGDSPVCECPNDELGDHPCGHPFRDLEAILQALDHLGQSDYVSVCNDAGIKPIQHPFWEDLPYVNIFRSITPDILHQLHQGVVKHVISWIKEGSIPEQINARASRMPPNHNTRIFQKGITILSRVTGSEHRQISTLLLGLLPDIPLANDVQPVRLIRAIRAILDFLYLAQYPLHSQQSLDDLDAALAEFHANKSVFVDLGVRTSFKIPKLHSLQHYAHSIRLFGTTDNYNTETTERLHIDFAKDAYRATNHKDELPQMTKWLERREILSYHADYVAWRLARPPMSPLVTETPSRTLHTGLGYRLFPKMTHHPTRKAVPINDITSSLPTQYGATRFIPAFARYVAQFNEPTLSSAQIEEKAATIYPPTNSFPVFHRVKFWNPVVHENETLDSIHVYPARVSRHGKSLPGRFDTALVRVSDEPGLRGLRVAQIRLVFTIPSRVLCLLFPSKPHPPRHLAYVEWFSQFTPSPDPDSGLYKVRKLTEDGGPIVSIVPVSLLVQSVHLFPKWGPKVPLEWTSATVLEKAPFFFVNAFQNLHTYHALSKSPIVCN